MIKKSVWLTGSRGFIGKHLVQCLIHNNFNIKCFTNNKFLNDKGGNNAHNLFYVNYASKDNIKEFISKFRCPDSFIHLGWGDMTIPMSKLHLTDNITEAKILIETLFEAGLKEFVFIGSMNEYGARVGALSEEMEPQGRLINYAKGKIEVAKYGFDMSKKFNSHFIHIRPFYVYGPGQRQGSLINELFEAYLNNRAPKLGSCDYYRDYIYVKDVAEGIVRSTDLYNSCTINLGIGTFIKVKDFVTMFWDKLGGDMERLNFGSGPMLKDEPDQPKSYADLTRLFELTGWKPSYSFEKGIDSTIESVISNRG